MQSPTDQFRPQLDPVYSATPERGTADVVESIDAVNRIKYLRESADVAMDGPESRADKVAREIFRVMNVFKEQQVAIVEPERPSIEPYMKHLGDMSDVIRNYQNEELRNANQF